MVTMYIEMRRRHAHTQTHMLAQGVDTEDKERKEKIFRCRENGGRLLLFTKPQHTAPSRTRFVAPAAAEIKEAETRQSPDDGIGDMTLSRQHCQDEKKKKNKIVHSTSKSGVVFFPEFLARQHSTGGRPRFISDERNEASLRRIHRGRSVSPTLPQSNLVIRWSQTRRRLDQIRLFSPRMSVS